MAAARFRVLCACVLCSLAMAVSVPSPALAQESRGSINGTVKDNSGGALPGVTDTQNLPLNVQLAFKLIF